MKNLILLLVAAAMAGCGQQEAPKSALADGATDKILACSAAIETLDSAISSAKCDSLSHDQQRKAAQIASDKNGAIVFLAPFEAKKAIYESNAKGDPELQPPSFSGVRDLAMKGNYQAQRNLAYGYSSHPYPGQDENKMLGCAWRIVIIKSGSEKVNETDVGNHDLYCGLLDKTSRIAAEAQAVQILKKIHSLPSRPAAAG